MSRALSVILASLSFAAPALAGGTVTLRFESSVDGAVVRPGDTIDWTITAEVSDHDNQGLAMIRVVVVPHPSSPAFPFISPADGVPVGMENFASPMGISIHDGAGVSAYTGTRSGIALLDIGGLQNTFGVAGATIGTNPNVIANVGYNGQEIASGSFLAPGSVGVYQIRIISAAANVLDQVNTPPAFSPVSPAQIVYAQNAFNFEVSLDCPGDLDGDVDVDLTDLAILLSDFDCTSGCAGDVDGDDDTDLTDLAILLANFDLTCN